jgi:uncharacterized protein (DUF697 family)
MHDLDHRSMEMSGESFEFTAEGEEEVFSETELQELAAEMLSVTQEAELNHFLGGLIKKAAGAVGKLVSSPMGQQLGGMLKGAAKKALPMAGRAIGDWVAPGAGGSIGERLGQQAGSMFGLETEGLSHEDREFEVAKQFVRLAADATKNAVSAPDTANPASVAQAAVTQAAQKFAPGLLSPAARPQGGGVSGRWVRKGRKIVIYGV